jgi:hypothetical protein
MSDPQCIPCTKNEIDWSEFPTDPPASQDLLNLGSKIKIQGVNSRLKVQLKDADIVTPIE